MCESQSGVLAALEGAPSLSSVAQFGLIYVLSVASRGLLTWPVDHFDQSPVVSVYILCGLSKVMSELLGKVIDQR